MDGSPQCGLLDATTLWHFDASERAPSTASLATDFAPQADVRFGPKADIACLFDHLVGTSQQGRWNVDTERLGRLQIYDELELGR